MSDEPRIIKMQYLNYKGELATRRIIPQRIWFGSTQWHPREQWMLSAMDLDRDAERDFALADCAFLNAE